MPHLSILAATAILAAAAGPTAVTVIDQTGGPPGHAHYVSLWQGSCDVGVITLSDRGRPVGRIARLNSALANLDASGMPDRTLTVRRYAVLLNGRAAEQGASGSATGLVGGRGVALAKRALAQADLDAGRLVAPFQIATAVDFAYYLVHPKTKGRLPQVKAFITWITAEAAAHEAALATIDNGAGI